MITNGGTKIPQGTNMTKKKKHYLILKMYGRIWTSIELTMQRRKEQPTPVLLPGKCPWMEEPGGLQSMGSKRVRHD